MKVQKLLLVNLQPFFKVYCMNKLQFISLTVSILPPVLNVCCDVSPRCVGVPYTTTHCMKRDCSFCDIAL